MRKLFICLGLVLLLFFSGQAIAQEDHHKGAAKGSNPYLNMDDYHFCHRCGMAVKKSDKVMTVTGVVEEPWYQCCPMCELVDMIESGAKEGKITAYGDKSKEKIVIDIADNQIKSIMPKGTVLLVGGSCPKNKVFYNKEHALKFIDEHPWAKKEMLKPATKAFAMLKNKKAAIKRCNICTTELRGHEKTWFTIMTKDKKRMVACCSPLCIIF